MLKKNALLCLGFRLKRTFLQIERGREARQKLLAKNRGFNYQNKEFLEQISNDTIASKTPIHQKRRFQDIRYSLSPHVSFSGTNTKRRRTSERLENRTANFEQRVCFLEFAEKIQNSKINLNTWFRECKRFSRSAFKHEYRRSSTEAKRFIDLESQRARRDHELAKRRGLDYPGYLNTQTNLGNYLHITDEYIPALDQCINQKLGIENFQLSSNSKGYSTCLITGEVNGEEEAKVWNQARNLTLSIFSALGLQTNLDHTITDDFTTLCIIDDNRRVVGVTEFVFMRDYVWIESMCVDKEMQNLGIGHMMVNMLVQIGAKTNKKLLLYALTLASSFYRSCGFEESSEFPTKFENGFYMTQKSG